MHENNKEYEISNDHKNWLMKVYNLIQLKGDEGKVMIIRIGKWEQEI